MAEFAQSFSPSSFTDNGLADAKEKVLQQIDRNRASGDVARDLSRQGLAEAADDELERDAAADAILARFKQPEQVS